MINSEANKNFRFDSSSVIKFANNIIKHGYNKAGRKA